MTIGENIRHYRKKLNMTQSRLADAIGVTVQAISKWETGAGMPDTAQIVPLAVALNISTDKLLMNDNKDMEYKKRWEYALRHYGDDPEKLLEVAKAVLAEDPDNIDFLYRAAVDEKRLADEAEDDRARHFHLGMALSYTNRLLKLDPSHGSAREHLVSVYSGLGMDDEAIAAAYRCENSSRALLWCLKGEALRRHLQKRIDERFHSLLDEIVHAGMPEVVEALIRTAIPDGNYQHYAFYLFRHGWERANAHAAQGNDDAVMGELRSLLDFAIDMDSAKADPRFTAPLFDLLEGFQNPPGVPTYLEQFIHETEYLFPQLAQREDYQALLAEAKAQQKGTA